jgi:phosphatidylethanolamine/phosphatidyl-N-methylethanolamine N-methyltransferase
LSKAARITTNEAAIRLREGFVQEPVKRIDFASRGPGLRLKPVFVDEARFIKNLFENPRVTGAVSPSGRFLAKAMARAIDPNGQGLVVELGPGTGPVTKALLERGVRPASLVLVEYEAGFCRLLAQRFPDVRVMQGDAYRLSNTLAELRGEPIRAVVSSLPLLNQPPERRRELLKQAFALMGPNGVFVQFTYGVVSPAPRRIGALTLSAEATAPIWFNLPPARVWTYRVGAASSNVTPLRLREKASCLADEWVEKAEAAARAIKERRAEIGAKARICAKDMIDEAKRSKALAALRKLDF